MLLWVYRGFQEPFKGIPKGFHVSGRFPGRSNEIFEDSRAFQGSLVAFQAVSTVFV